MWELNHEEGWVTKNCCFWTVVLEMILETPLDSNSKPLNLKGNQPWIFVGRTEAEAPILWPPNGKANSLEKTLMLRKIERRKRGGDRGWDGWMASLTQGTCIWANSGRLWRAGKPGALQSMGLQRIRHNWATEQQQSLFLVNSLSHSVKWPFQSFPTLFELCLLTFWKKVLESEVAQSCLTLCDPMDCSLPGSSLHGILQARILECVAISFSMGSSRPRDRTRVSCIPGRSFNRWATK